MSRFDPNDPLTPDAEARLEDLCQRPWRELLELPAHSQVELNCGGKRGVLSVYRDLLPDEKIRLVVQLYMPGRLGSAKVVADGFVVSMKEEHSMLQDEDLYDFI
jgi:hypothetical protein